MRIKHPEIVLEFVRQKFGHLSRQAWVPAIENDDGELSASKFAGKPWIAHVDKWPVCPHCHEYMRFFLQLDLHNLPTVIACGKYSDKLFQFFGCDNADCYWRVDIDSAPFTSCKLVRIVPFVGVDEAEYEIPEFSSQSAEKFSNKEVVPKLIVDWMAIEEYPSWEEALLNDVEVSDDEIRTLIARAEIYPPVLTQNFGEILADCGAYHSPIDKLGGWPNWIQGVQYPFCPECGAKMQNFIFQIESNNNLPFSWGDYGALYVFQCPQHWWQVTSIMQCG